MAIGRCLHRKPRAKVEIMDRSPETNMARDARNLYDG